MNKQYPVCIVPNSALELRQDAASGRSLTALGPRSGNRREPAYFRLSGSNKAPGEPDLEPRRLEALGAHHCARPVCCAARPFSRAQPPRVCTLSTLLPQANAAADRTFSLSPRVRKASLCGRILVPVCSERKDASLG